MPENTRLRKVTLYVLDLNDPMSEADLKSEFQNMKHVPFVTVGNIETAYVGEFHDDHELNKRGADHEKYFRK